MALRATDADVREIIDTTSTIPTLPFIKAASNLVDKVSSNDSDSVLGAADLREIERWLAAGLYGVRDQLYKSKKSGDASAIFQTGESGLGPFEQNDYLRTAMVLDTTGYLAQMNAQAKKGGAIEIGMTWVGTPKSSQLDYEDRD